MFFFLYIFNYFLYIFLYIVFIVFPVFLFLSLYFCFLFLELKCSIARPVCTKLSHKTMMENSRRFASTSNTRSLSNLHWAEAQNAISPRTNLNVAKACLPKITRYIYSSKEHHNQCLFHQMNFIRDLNSQGLNYNECHKWREESCFLVNFHCQPCNCVAQATSLCFRLIYGATGHNYLPYERCFSSSSMNLTKLRIILLPSGVMMLSGWNWTPWNSWC
jgi:hypothetical protein